jgi:hypothetical protein
MRSALLCISGGVADRPDSAASPALHRLLSRSRRTAVACASPQAWLCELFGVRPGPDYPVAALSLLGEGGEPGPHAWLRADPVHLQADQGVLILRAARHLDLPYDEARALAAALNRHFEPDGLRFLPLRADRWYVRVGSPPEVLTQPPSAAEGRSIDALLPAGPDAMILHRWFNEAQMVLHVEPVNEAREARGAPPINSVWLWGAGTLPRVDPPEVVAAWGDDPLLQGLCHQAGIPVAPVGDGSDWLARAGPGRHLIVPDGEADALERDWFAPLLAALRSRALHEAAFVFPQGPRASRFDLRTSDLWKFWRRGTPLASAAHA